MYAKAEGFQVEDEYDFLPHHDAPEISFEEAMQQYGGEQLFKNEEAIIGWLFYVLFVRFM